MLDWLNANGATVQAVTTVILVAVTGFYAWQTQKQARAARATIDEMVRMREAQARAHLAIEIWPWDRRYKLFDLAIRNYGGGPARDVRVVFDPDIRYPQYAGGTMNELEIMSCPILGSGRFTTPTI
ncbi:MAG: hypothetical protein HW416_1251 [Chloroflexi bacterium]|nr:hypothetical protein [Chloroflexota bacterium]